MPTHTIPLTVGALRLICHLRHACDEEAVQSAALAGVGLEIVRLADDDIRLVATASDGKILARREIILRDGWTTETDGKRRAMTDPCDPDALMLDTRELIIPAATLSAWAKRLPADKHDQAPARLVIVCHGGGRADVGAVLPDDDQSGTGPLAHGIQGLYPDCSQFFVGRLPDPKATLPIALDPGRLARLIHAMGGHLSRKTGRKTGRKGKVAHNATYAALVPMASLGREGCRNQPIAVALLGQHSPRNPWAGESAVRGLIMPVTLPL